MKSKLQDMAQKQGKSVGTLVIEVYQASGDNASATGRTLGLTPSAVIYHLGRVRSGRECPPVQTTFSAEKWAEIDRLMLTTLTMPEVAHAAGISRQKLYRMMRRRREIQLEANQ